MPVATHSYKKATSTLAPVLVGFPKVLIALDGRQGAGKTTLGRYLAWHFNITFIETDLFLKQKGGFKYRFSELERVISSRLRRGKPVIVEGVALKWLLEQIGLVPSFTIYVRNLGPCGDVTVLPHIEAYEASYNPAETSDFVLELSH